MATLFDQDVSVPPRAGHYRTIYADAPWNEAGAGLLERVTMRARAVENGATRQWSAA